MSAMCETDQLVSDLITRETIVKAWGAEEIIVNNDTHCGKLLWLLKPHCGSLHYHDLKDETFMALSGQIEVTYYDIDGDLDKVETVVLDGDQRTSLRIPPRTAHRMRPLTPVALIAEFSTPHSDNDVTRLEESY